MPFKVMKLCADLSSVLCVILGWVWGRVYVAAGVTSVRPIGDTESEGFIFVLPTFDQTTVDLIVPAAMIAIVGFLETIAVGGKMANEKRYSYDANQELLALGTANIGGAFMAAFPITGGFSRTAVNSMFGASSQLAGALTSVVVILAAYLLMPVVEVLPLSALAPLIIHGAIGVTDFKSFIATFKANKLDFVIMVLTFVVSLGITVKEGLATGVCLSILKLTYEIAMPNIAICGQGRRWHFPRLPILPGSRDDPEVCCSTHGCQLELCEHSAAAGVQFACYERGCYCRPLGELPDPRLQVGERHGHDGLRGPAANMFLPISHASPPRTST